MAKSKQKGKTHVAADKKRVAKPVGARFKGNDYRTPTAAQIKRGKKTGKVYTESRANRSDKKVNVKAGIGRNVSYGIGGLF